jgi:DNA-binding NtrC family response regulator
MRLAKNSDMLIRQDVSSSIKDTSPPILPTQAAEIIVVDDLAECRDAVVWPLLAEGYRVRTASGGDEAVSLLAATTPALVISDLWMPQGSGWDLLTTIQQNWPHVPVMLMTSGLFGLHPNIERWAAARLEKPISPLQLLSEVDRLVRLRLSAKNPNPAGLTPRGPAG